MPVSFSSLGFLPFLAIVFGLYWLCPHRHRWLVILTASYAFYMQWNVRYTILILGVTLVSYLCALGISRSARPQMRRFLLAGNVAVNLLLLFAFKYFSFVADSLSALLHMASPPFSGLLSHLILPVGISFYTFQAMGYVIDVYRGETPAERHFGKYAAFISFFPQLVAGPIERTRNLLPQLTREQRFDYDEAAWGLKLMAWGYFKKLVIADNLALLIDPIYANVHAYKGFALVLAAVMFTIQIYCDFSGYSDIAIGAARLFGIRLMTNFTSPFFARSLRDLWARWHISLSTWFRDYVYFPLGGNRKGRLRSSVNLLATFAISGLWHGAGWNYLLWGLLHGVGRVVENLLPSRGRPRPSRNPLPVLLVFAFNTLTFVIFRAGSFSDARYILTHAFSGLQHPLTYLRLGYSALQLTPFIVLALGGAILLLLIHDYFNMKTDVLRLTSRLHWSLRWTLYIALVFIILFLMPQQLGNHFIYFQF